MWSLASTLRELTINLLPSMPSLKKYLDEKQVWKTITFNKVAKLLVYKL